MKPAMFGASPRAGDTIFIRGALIRARVLMHNRSGPQGRSLIHRKGERGCVRPSVRSLNHRASFIARGDELRAEAYFHGVACLPKIYVTAYPSKS